MTALADGPFCPERAGNLSMTEVLRGAYDAVASRVSLKPATALRACMAEGYDLRRFRADLLAGIVVGIVALPLFFGAAGRAMGSLDNLAGHVKVLILDLEDVPAVDATGLVVLEEALEKLAKKGVFVVFAGLQSQPQRALAKAGIVAEEGRLAVTSSRELALGIATARVKG